MTHNPDTALGLPRPTWRTRAGSRLVELAPGLLLAGVIACAAQFAATVTPLPAVLIALLLGAMVPGLTRHARYSAGASFAARDLLRIGIALLGAKVSLGVLGQLGWTSVGIVAATVAVSVAGGTLLGRAFGLPWRLAALAAGAVSICGASAALAVATALPRREDGEAEVARVVAAVTVVGAVAMALYPPLAAALGLNDLQTGVFLGGAIHEVAQAVGAGYGVSDRVGELATTVKLLRVACLAPAVVAIGLAFRAPGGAAKDHPPVLPGFLIAFLILAAAASLGLTPAPVAALAGEVSRWTLLAAIAALGMKISLPGLIAAGGRPVAAIVAQSLLLAGLVLGAASLLLTAV